MDELDEAIASKRREVALHSDELRRNIERRRRAKVELAALEYAASLRPARSARRRSVVPPAEVNGGAERSRRRGRQPGAITQSSRAFLEAVHSVGRPATYEDIQAALEFQNANMEMAQVRNKARRLGGEYLRGDRTAGFELTDAGLAKIGQPQNEEGPDDTRTAVGAASSKGGVVDYDDDIPF